MHRICFAAVASLVLLAAGTARAQYPFVSSSSICYADSFYVIFTNVDPTGDPYAYPDWVGYDILRRAVPECTPPVTVNAEMIPRVFGTTTHYFGGITPAPGTLYEYVVRPVDADHQPVSIPGYCQPCASYATCEPLTTPFTVGNVYDAGWAVFVNPCPCHPPAYVENPQADALRPYAGTSTTVRLFGQAGCGTVEGCALSLEHFDIVPNCAVTAASTRTWGQVKIRYR
jgi:hypothetical protein